MRRKTIIPRDQANRDVDEAISHYLSAATAAVALGFIDALEQADTHIGRHPATGSPHYAYELDLPGLRLADDALSLPRVLRRAPGSHRRVAGAARPAGHPGVDAGARQPVSV